jgi:hypothetical protein
MTVCGNASNVVIGGGTVDALVVPKVLSARGQSFIQSIKRKVPIIQLAGTEVKHK